MLLKLKNKTLLAMDKLIKESTDKGGKPDCFVFEPQEAADFFREIRLVKDIFKSHLEIKQVSNSDNVDVRFLLQAELSRDTLHLLINKWLKHDLLIFYKNIEIIIVRKKKLDVPKPQGQHDSGDGHVLKEIPLLESPVEKLEALPTPPTPPPARIISEDVGAPTCKTCGSSVHRKWGFLGINGCINPICNNYFNKN